MIYQMVIGLEVHVQMNTKTKIFCGCPTEFTDLPNINTCVVCQGHPGTLPVLNENAIKKAIFAAQATNCTINHTSLFDRKGYSYPDLPKGYQTTQFYQPICEKGFITIEKADGTQKDIRINHIHVEEDAGKLIHAADSINESYVDLNRAGIPLLEIVSEPDIRTVEEAVLYATKLRQLMVYADVTDGNMQEGSIRFDVNLSIMKEGDSEFGTRTETKNLNSFTALKKSIEMEYERQVSLLEKGEKVQMETRLFNADTMESRSLRVKNDGEAGYLYFRDPDIPPVVLQDEYLQEVLSSFPPTPDMFLTEFTQDCGIKTEDALILISEKEYAVYIQKAIQAYPKYSQKIANFFLSDVVRLVKENKINLNLVALDAKELGRIFELIEDGSLSLKMAKQFIPVMIKEGKAIDMIMKEQGASQISDESELKKIIQSVLDQNKDSVQKYQNGKVQLLGFFVGQIMKASQGKANPALVNKLLKAMLDNYEC